MLSNSEFIVMLNQAASDREKLGRLLNISNEQMNYITNVEAGSGLVFLYFHVTMIYSSHVKERRTWGR